MRFYPAKTGSGSSQRKSKVNIVKCWPGPKFNIPDATQQRWIAFIEANTICVEPSAHAPFPRDPKDEPFIAAALASNADYLITGDKDLLDEQPLASTQIVRPADFARSFAIA